MQFSRLTASAVALVALAACNFGASSSVPGFDAGGLDGSQSGSNALLSASTLTEAFGNVDVGSAAPAMTLVVTNTGGGASGPLVVALSGAAAASFAVDTDACTGVALAAHAQCSVAAHFAPTAPGASTADLTVTGQPGGALDVTLSGTGAQHGALSFTTTTQGFGAVAPGSTSAATTFTLQNAVGATGAITVALVGTNADQFALSNDGCTGPLAAGAKCTVDAAFAPTTTGAMTATLQATDPAGDSASVALTGTGAAPAAFTVTPASYDFGSLTVGATSPAQTFTVGNSGGVPSGVPAVAGSGTHAADFTLTSACPAALAPGATCTFTATFTPSVTGAEGPSTVTVSGAGTTSATGALRGTGLAPAAVTITPGTQSFGTSAWGTTGADVPFTVTNTGGVTTGPLTVGLSGSFGSQFALGGQSDCAGATLAAATGQCTVYVHFAPASPATGMVQASLDVSGTPGGTTAATLSGDAEPPAQLAFGMGTYAFGSPTQGMPSSPVTLTVENTGGVPSGVPGVPAVTGTYAADFSVLTNNCTAALPAGQTCTMSVVFTPSTTMAESASIATTATPGGTATATLQGSGLTTASLAITPNPGNTFAATTVTHTSAPVTFTVTNSGQTDSAAIATPTFTGGNSGNFALAANNCTSFLAKSGGTCTFQVTFTPSTATTETTTLGVTDTSGHAATDTLSGTGLTKPTLAITPKPGNTFASTVQDLTSAPVTFTVTNSGQTDSTTLGGPTFAGGTNPTDFAYVAGSSTCTVVTKNGGTCTFEATFSPSTVGTETTTVTIADSGGDSASDALSATGLQPTPLLGIDVSSFTFPNVPNPKIGAFETFTVTNKGTAPTAALQLQNAATPFTIPGGSDGCSNTVLPKTNGSCTFEVEFDPSSPGLYADTMTVYDSASDSQPLALAGAGTCTGVCIVIVPSPVDFGTVSYPNTKMLSPTARNFGTVASDALSTATSGGNYPYFAPVLDQCKGAALAPFGSAGDSCTFLITFTPPNAHGTLENLDYQPVDLGTATTPNVAQAWLYATW